MQLDTEFQAEISGKSKQIEATHRDLHAATKKLTESRRQLEALKEQASKLANLNQRCRNLEDGIQEEEAHFLAQTSNSPEDYEKTSSHVSISRKY